MTARSIRSPRDLSAICLARREDERADLGQRVLAAPRHDERPVAGPLLDLEGEALPRAVDLVALPRPPDEPLDARDRVLRVDDAALLGRVADEHLAVRVERHDARQQAPALLVGEDVDTSAAHAGRNGVGGTQVDSNDRHRRWT